MKISVRSLLAGEVGDSLEESTKLAPGSIDDLDLHSGELRGQFTRVPEGIIADLVGEATVTLVCDRCLDEFEADLSFRSSEEFAEETGEDAWPIDKKWQIDLAEPVRQSFILAIPIHPLCREDCPGLCLVCGLTLKDNHKHTKDKEK
jgi:uncharacterized protein